MVLVQTFAREHRAEGGAIIDDDPAVAVENLPARSEQRDGLDAIALSQLTIYFVVADLQNPEAREQKQEYGHGRILERGNAAQGETGIVAEQAAGRLLWTPAIGFKRSHWFIP
jgi:hypothetical protein